MVDGRCNVTVISWIWIYTSLTIPGPLPRSFTILLQRARDTTRLKSRDYDERRLGSSYTVFRFPSSGQESSRPLIIRIADNQRISDPVYKQQPDSRLKKLLGHSQTHVTAATWTQRQTLAALFLFLFLGHFYGGQYLFVKSNPSQKQNTLNNIELFCKPIVASLTLSVPVGEEN